MKRNLVTGIFWITFSGVALSLSSPESLPGTPDQKLFHAITDARFFSDRAPWSGAIRKDKNQTDIRSAFEGATGKELFVTVWSPRVHPFKSPPDFMVRRPCLPGEYIETTMGVADFTKTHVLRRPVKEQKLLHAFERNLKTNKLKKIPPPELFPQKYDLLGTAVEFTVSGTCLYRPTPLNTNETVKSYLKKHIEIAQKVHATDIIFPKTVFDFISKESDDISGEYAFSLSHLSDLTIDFSGSTFLLPPTRGAILLKENHRIAIRNLTFEWAKLDNSKNGSRTSIHGIYAPRENNTDLWLETLSFKRVPGWAIKLDQVKGAVISSTVVAPIKGDNRFAAQEGAVNAINSQDIIIRNNTFTNLGGDAISIHGQLGRVAATLTQSLRITSDRSSQEKEASSVQPEICTAIGTHWGTYSAGETLGFFDEKMVYQGANSIISVGDFSLEDPIVRESCQGFRDCQRVCFKPNPDFSPKPSGFVTTLSSSPSSVIVHGNAIEKVSGRGIVLQGSNGILSNNVISHIAGPGIQLTADLAHALQGPGAFNIRLKDNQLNHVSEKENVNPTSTALFGGILIASSHKQMEGSVTPFLAPLIQNVLIDGLKSIVDNSGSVALQIDSAQSIKAKFLSIGSAGLIRDLSSGLAAEGSVLVSNSRNIDLTGLSSPPLTDFDQARHRTIVVDAETVMNLSLPLITKGFNGKTAHTLWSTTFRSWFKEDLSKPSPPVIFSLEQPTLSKRFTQPPIEVFPVVTPKIGDKELASVGDPISLTFSPKAWNASVNLGPLSPNRIQLKAKSSRVYSDLFLSVSKIRLAPRKTAPDPFESVMLFGENTVIAFHRLLTRTIDLFIPRK